MRYLYILSLLLISLTSSAQQDPLQAQYFNNPVLVNPAFAGSLEAAYAGLVYRTQWTGIDGNPTLLNVNAHMPLVNNRIGLGTSIMQDKVGNNRSTFIEGIAAYHLPLEKSTFSFGMQFGVTQFTTNVEGLTIKNPDPLFTPFSQTSINTGVGIMLKSDKYRIGFSVPHLLSGTANIDGQNIQLYSQNYYLTGSYLLRVTEKVELRPSALVRYAKGSKPSADLNVNLTLRQAYTAGVLTRNFHTYGLLLQAVLSNARISYIFEVPAGKSALPFNTHEIALGFLFPVLPSHNKLAPSFN